MSCEELLRRLSEYDDGVLDVDVCRELEAHLEGCSECAELRHDLEALARVCRSCDRPRLPAQLRRRIGQMLGEAGRV